MTTNLPDQDKSQSLIDSLHGIASLLHIAIQEVIITQARQKLTTSQLEPDNKVEEG